MSDFWFDETNSGFDQLVSDIREVDKKNNLMFKRICKDVFRKSHAKLVSQNNLDTGTKMLGVCIASAIKKASNRYEKGYFEKSVQKLNSRNNIPTYSDMVMANHILDGAVFAFAVKLLKILYMHGLSEAISSALRVEVVTVDILDSYPKPL